MTDELVASIAYEFRMIHGRERIVARLKTHPNIPLADLSHKRLSDMQGYGRDSTP